MATETNPSGPVDALAGLLYEALEYLDPTLDAAWADAPDDEREYVLLATRRLLRHRAEICAALACDD